MTVGLGVRSLRLLVVDDSRALTRGVARDLESLGHRVDVENDPARALVACRSEPYDVVFCDLVMPGLDGLDVLEQTATTRGDTRFVLMSGYLETDDVLAAHRAGAHDYLHKPFGRRELVEVLDRLALEVPGAAAAPPPAPAPVDEVAERGDGLPPPSKRLLDAVRLLARTHPDVAAVDARFSDDALVGAAAIDPAFGGPGGAPELKRAIETTGAVRVLTLAASLGLRETYEAASEHLGERTNLLWRVHCTTSFIAEALAVKRRIGQPERVQLMVLLSQIGELATVLSAVREDPALWQRDRPSSALVERVAATTGQASVAVLEGWGLPPGVVATARGLVADPRGQRGIVGLAASARRATLCGFGHYPFAPRHLDYDSAIPGAGGDLVRRLFHEASRSAGRLDLHP